MLYGLAVPRLRRYFPRRPDAPSVSASRQRHPSLAHPRSLFPHRCRLAATCREWNQLSKDAHHDKRYQRIRLSLPKGAAVLPWLSKRYSAVHELELACSGSLLPVSAESLVTAVLLTAVGKQSVLSLQRLSISNCCNPHLLPIIAQLPSLTSLELEGAFSAMQATLQMVHVLRHFANPLACRCCLSRTGGRVDGPLPADKPHTPQHPFRHSQQPLFLPRGHGTVLGRPATAAAATVTGGRQVPPVTKEICAS